MTAAAVQFAGAVRDRVIAWLQDSYTPEPNTGCWLWLRGVNALDYGVFRLGMRKTGVIGGVHGLAHRISYACFVGPIPIGMSVLHRCDTPLCINPEHLFVGTQIDNMMDALNKGRLPSPPKMFGSQHANAKLTEAQVIAMRSEFQAGASKRGLAKRFGITRQNVISIISRATWRHLP